MSDGKLEDSAVSCLMTVVMNCRKRIGIRWPSKRKIIACKEVEDEMKGDENSKEAESTLKGGKAIAEEDK